MASDQTDRRNGLTTGLAIKPPVKAATTASLGAAKAGLSVIDGYQTVAGDRILRKNEADAKLNGIWNAAAGTWTRAKDCDGNLDLTQGTIVHVLNGTVSAGLFYECTTTGSIVIGTSNLTWAVVSPSSPITLPLSLAQGGTAATSAISALSNLGVIQVTAEAGTANAQTGTIDALVTAFRADQIFEYVPNITNTGAVTLTLTPAGGAALAARNVFYDGAACAGGELVLGVPTLLLDDGVRLHIVGYSRKIRGSQLSAGSQLINGTIVPTNNATQLTLTIKTLAGADPSAADPVGVVFRNVTAGTGDYTVLWLTAATLIQTTVGGTFGVANNIAFRLWITMFNDGGTLRLGVVNCLTTAAGAGSGRDVTALNSVGLGAWGIASSTQIGAGSTAAQTHYTSGAAVAAKAYATIGYLTYEAGLAAAGTFTANPSRLQLFGPGVALPGQLVQSQCFPTGAVATGTTTVPNDDTIPQNTEGDQYISQAITPSSAANMLRMTAAGHFTNSVIEQFTMSLFQDAVANALKTSHQLITNAASVVKYDLVHEMVANLSVATTMKIRAGGSAAGTTTFNGSGGSRLYGGVLSSFLRCEEIMA